MKFGLRRLVAASFALALSFPAYSQVISPAPGGSGSGSLTAPSTITGTISGSSNKGAIGFGTLTYSDTNNFGAFQTSVNSYAQFVLQNSNGGATASADYVVSNDLGTATTYYGNFGINSSGFTGTGSLNLANATYLTATSGDLVLGTTTSNAVHFVINGGSTDALTINTAGAIQINGNGLLTSPASATFHLGAADAAAPVAQTIGVQGVVAGTSNTNGANFTIAGSQSTGTGLGGSLIFQVSPAGTTGTSQNALVTALTIDSTKLATFAANINT